MTSDRNGAALRAMRTLFNAGAVAGLTDGQLLERFATRGGEAGGLAFAALVERHGSMVLRVCRRTLADPHDAQDAFQTTFLVLVQKAGTIRNRDSIASWLHGVAHRVASCTRSAAARRRLHEARYADGASRAVEAPDDREALSAIHEEIERLPERFRAPVVLCDLEGLAHEQAARHLGCPAGTVKSRLSRGRERLGDRLRRRGLAPAIGMLGAPALPARGLIDATTSAALRAAADRLAAGEVPASVLSLATGALGMMRLNAWKRRAAACALAVALTGSGLAVAGILAGPDDPGPARPPAKAAASRPPAAEAPEALDFSAVEGRGVDYEVKFLEFPGLSFREMGLGFDFDLDPPAGIAFLSDVEMDLLTRHLGETPNASLVPAPMVSTPLDAQAVILNPGGHGPPSSSVEPRPSDAPERPALRPKAEASVHAPFDRSDEGCTVRLKGVPSADGRYFRMTIKVRDLHLVQVHSSDAPGREGRRIEVPEVVRTDVDTTVTIPVSGALLVGLGLSRTVDDAGASKVAERLVLIRPRGLPIPPPLPAVVPPPPQAY